MASIDETIIDGSRPGTDDVLTVRYSSWDKTDDYEAGAEFYILTYNDCVRIPYHSFKAMLARLNDFIQRIEEGQ